MIHHLIQHRDDAVNIVANLQHLPLPLLYLILNGRALNFTRSCLDARVQVAVYRGYCMSLVLFAFDAFLAE